MTSLKTRTSIKIYRKSEYADMPKKYGNIFYARASYADLIRIVLPVLEEMAEEVKLKTPKTAVFQFINHLKSKV